MFLKNKVVLLTGASSGIGKAIAFELAKKGANLVLVSRREEVLSELADTLEREYDIQTLVLAKDLSKVKEIEETVEETINAFGHIDYLILICKTSLKANQLIDMGDIEGFQKMSKVYD